MLQKLSTKIKPKHLAYFNIFTFFVFILNIISVLPYTLFEDKFDRSVRTFWLIPKYLWREFHYSIGGWLLFLIGIHLLLHWAYIKNMKRIILPKETLPPPEKNSDQ
ncbi:MAG: DUF4405 domain-containing protein [Patescibacteria group bacterium]